MHRLLVVMLSILAFVLIGCQQSEGPSDEDIAAILGDTQTDTDRLFLDLSLSMQWVTPNPDSNWVIAGRDIQRRDDLTIRIAIRLEAKNSSGEDFEAAIARLTASNLEYDETDTGEQYARINDGEDNIIYRNFEDFVVIIRLSTFTDDPIDPIIFEEWETIALEGGLNILD
ncbi:MAG: hypothetical protein AAF846_10895 [Chloroflexota bacterium]